MRFAFWGNFGTHNLGNECTLHAMVASARRFAPDAELVSVCVGTDDTAERHGIEAVPMAPTLSDDLAQSSRAVRQLRLLFGEVADWFRVVGAMRGVDRVIVTGTGILTDTYEGPFGKPYQMFKWAAAARLCGHRVAFVSVGAERLTVPYKLRLMGWALRLADYRSYRDGVSKRRAEGLAAVAKDDPVFPDLAFSLPPELTSARPSSRPAGPTTVAVGVYTVDGDQEVMERYVETIGRFVLWLLERGYAVRIVIGDVAYDLDALNNVRAWLARHDVGHRVVDEAATSFELLLTQLSTVDLVVATRFHNVLLSLLLEKPVVSVSHMDKNDELMESMGLSSYRLPLKDVRVEDLVAKFGELERNADALRAQIREKNALFRAQLDAQYERIFGTPAQER
jgi:polysaccharide pyruvyl transferase WcaK-like protein